MAKTSIEWTDATWNPIRGCSRVSEGCRHCYAERVAARFSGEGMPYQGLARILDGQPRWTGQMEFIQDALTLPLRWKKPRRIFVNSMSDLFHENVKDEWIAAIFAVMALTPRHTYQVLTKRPQQMAGWFSRVGADPGNALTELALRVEEGPWGEEFDATLGNYINGWSGFREKPDGNPMNGTVKRWPLPNVWLGVSVENQHFADERIPLLLATPAAVRWISAEPLLGPIDVTAIRRTHAEGFMRPLDGRFNRVTWVVCGGESGPHARPMHPDWARSLRDQCQDAGVPFFFKQWGEWGPTGSDVKFQKKSFMVWTDKLCWMARWGKKDAGRLLDGREWNEYPEQVSK